MNDNYWIIHQKQNESDLVNEPYSVTESSFLTEPSLLNLLHSIYGVYPINEVQNPGLIVYNFTQFLRVSNFYDSLANKRTNKHLTLTRNNLTRSCKKANTNRKNKMQDFMKKFKIFKNFQ